MATQDFAIFDNKVVKKFLSDLTKNYKDISKRDRKYIGVVSALVYEDIIRHFENEEGPDGNWEEWSDIYDAHMQKIGKSGNKLLQDTGKLRQKMMPVMSGKATRISKKGILWFNNAKASGGFPIAYAHDNDDGTRTTLPQRSFMWLSDKGLDKIAQQTLSFILGEK